MTVSLKSKSGNGFNGSKVAYNDKGDIVWTARTKSGYKFATEAVYTSYNSSGDTRVTCRADVSAIQTNAFTDTVKTLKAHGVYGSDRYYYSYTVGKTDDDPTDAAFDITTKNIHIKNPNVQYIDVISVTTSTPAVGDPRYEGTDSDRYYSEYMTVDLGSLSDLLNADGKPIVRAETKVSKLNTITGSGKPYDNALADSSTEYTSVYNFSGGVAYPPTKKYEAGIYENWLRLDILSNDANGNVYQFAPDVKLFVNGHLIEFAYISYNSPPAISRLDVNYYFDVGSVTQYDKATVDVTAITPTVGEKPKGIDSVSVIENNDIEVTKLQWFVDANGNGKFDLGEEVSVGNGSLADDGTFKADKKYSVDLEVGVADGSEGRLARPFKMNVKYDSSLTAAAQTKEQTVSSVDPKGVFTFPYNYITLVDEKVYEPDDGIYTKYTPLIYHKPTTEGKKKGYSLSSYVYKNLDGSLVSETDLTKGKQYWYVVSFEHLYNESLFAPPLTVAKVDGQPLKCSGSDTKSWYEVSSNAITIHYLFTVPDVTPVGYTVSGTSTSFNSSTDDVTLRLIESGASEPAYETVIHGNSTTYSINNVLPGTYTLRVMKKNHVTRDYTVTVGNGNKTQNVKICLSGDVTGDGVVDMKDWGRVRAHINETNKLTDSYSLACADVTKDGKIDMKDWGRIRSHINETNPLW